MREIIARIVCFFTVGVVVALSLLFARVHNPPASAVAAPLQSASPPGLPPPIAAVPAATLATPLAPATDALARGRAVYSELGCASCHSIAGNGNPRNPLDGVGDRRDAAALEAWITGTGAATDELAPAVTKRKQRYRDVAPDDMAALVKYLSSLVGVRKNETP